MFNLTTSLLREDPRLQAGPVAEELARRASRPKSKVQSYRRTSSTGSRPPRGAGSAPP